MHFSRVSGGSVLIWALYPYVTFWRHRLRSLRQAGARFGPLWRQTSEPRYGLLPIITWIVAGLALTSGSFAGSAAIPSVVSASTRTCALVANSAGETGATLIWTPESVFNPTGPVFVVIVMFPKGSFFTHPEISRAFSTATIRFNGSAPVAIESAYSWPANGLSFCAIRSCWSWVSDLGALNFSNATCASRARAFASGHFY